MRANNIFRLFSSIVKHTKRFSFLVNGISRPEKNKKHKTLNSSFKLFLYMLLKFDII